MGNTRSKKMRLVLIGACVLMLAVWGVLIAVLLHGSKKSGDGDEAIRVLKSVQRTSKSYSYLGKDQEEYDTDVWEYRYDSKGRLTNVSYYPEGKLYRSYDLEYYYDGDLPVTRMTLSYYSYYSTKTEDITEVEKDRYEYYPSGKIRSHAEYWQEDSQSYSRCTYYDEKRHETGWTDYDEEGSVKRKYRNQLDRNGYEISYEIWEPENDEWTPSENSKSERDAEGRVRKQYMLNDGEWELTCEIEYDDDGARRQTDYTRYSKSREDGTWRILPKLSWRYDPDDRLIEVAEYDYWSADEPFVECLTTYEYTDNGGYTEKRVFNSGAASTGEYDRDGQTIWEESVDSKGKVCWIVRNTYDENGHILKNRTSKDGENFTETIYRYDREGRLIYHGSADESDGWYYEYDQHGNLIREWSGSNEGVCTTYQYKEIQISKEQLEENKKFYMDDPSEMPTIVRQRGE